MAVLAKALSQLSPRLQTDMSIPASASLFAYRMDTHCMPRSEWWAKDHIAGRRWQMAWLRTSSELPRVGCISLFGEVYFSLLHLVRFRRWMRLKILDRATIEALEAPNQSDARKHEIKSTKKHEPPSEFSGEQSAKQTSWRIDIGNRCRIESTAEIQKVSSLKKQPKC